MCLIFIVLLSFRFVIIIVLYVRFYHLSPPLL